MLSADKVGKSKTRREESQSSPLKCDSRVKKLQIRGKRALAPAGKCGGLSH